VPVTFALKVIFLGVSIVVELEVDVFVPLPVNVAVTTN
jgi:hypothetical protein